MLLLVFRVGLFDERHVVNFVIGDVAIDDPGRLAEGNDGVLIRHIPFRSKLAMRLLCGLDRIGLRIGNGKQMELLSLTAYSAVIAHLDAGDLDFCIVQNFNRHFLRR